MGSGAAGGGWRPAAAALRKSRLPRKSEALNPDEGAAAAVSAAGAAAAGGGAAAAGAAAAAAGTAAAAAVGTGRAPARRKRVAYSSLAASASGSPR